MSQLSFAANYGNLLVTKDQISVRDGDTLELTIKEFPPIIGDRIGVRLKGFDTPEMHGDCQYERELAQKAKDFTSIAILNAKIIELRNLDRDKYFRIDAELWIDGKDIANMLIANKLAYPYFGGTKTAWCPPL